MAAHTAAREMSLSRYQKMTAISSSETTDPQGHLGPRGARGRALGRAFGRRSSSRSSARSSSRRRPSITPAAPRGKSSYPDPAPRTGEIAGAVASVHGAADAPEPPAPGRAELVRYGALVSLGAAGTVIGLYALYTVRAILVRILIALFIAVSLDPAVRLLTRRGMRRGWAVTLIFPLAFALAAGFLLSVIPPLVTEGRNLIDDLPGHLTRLQGRSAQFRELDDRYNISDQLQGLAGTLPSRLGSAARLTSRAFGAVFNSLTILVFTIYFMADMPRIRAGVVRLFPMDRRPPGGSSTWWSTRSAAT